ncbi:MAG: cell division topological specificity factor MinE [Aquificaceae bacterium]
MFIFNQGSSKEEAKKRLTMVLTYERKGLPPNFVDRLKEDLISVFSKYPQLEVENIEVDLKRKKEDLEELHISIPFRL